MKRSITLAGHKTSVTVEDDFWQGMRLIARDESTTLISLVSRIDGARHKGTNLSSAIRVFVLNYFQLHFSSQSYPLQI
jgi:predicted DNA-binding ribbon-helix-helix protein